MLLMGLLSVEWFKLMTGRLQMIPLLLCGASLFWIFWQRTTPKSHHDECLADSKSDSEANLLHTDHNNISEHDGNVGMAYPPMKLPPTPHFIAIMRPSRVTLPMLLTYLRRLVIRQPDAEGSGRRLTSNRRCLCNELVFGCLLLLKCGNIIQICQKLWKNRRKIWLHLHRLVHDNWHFWYIPPAKPVSIYCWQ